MVVGNVKKASAKPNSSSTSWLALLFFTDSLKSYEGLDEFQHEVVDHAVEYAHGEVSHQLPGKLLVVISSVA